MTKVQPQVQYVAGGTVQAGDGVYVRRVADQALLRSCREGTFAYVLTSRQMGKSSLMIRTVEVLIEDGVKPVIIDLTELGADITAEQWYRGFLEKVAEPLDLQASVRQWWDVNQHLSPAQRLNRFMIEVVLRQVHERVVVFIDEIDTTLRLDFTDDFFASIRYLYNARATVKELARLSFVLLGVASPGDLMKDAERTPFNIGERVDLLDFTEEDAIRDLGAEPDLVRSVFHYTNGHPYLTLRVFRSLSEQPLSLSLEAHIDALFWGDQAEKDSNLQFVRDMLTKRARNREAVLLRYRDICKGRQVPDREADPVCAWLKLSGVVRSSFGVLNVRNRIYGRVFDLGWIRRNRKVNWARRATIGAYVVIGLLAFLAPLAIWQARVAWRESKLAELRESEAKAASQREHKARLAEAEARRISEQNANFSKANAAKAEELERIAEESGTKSRTYELISGSLLSQDSDPEVSVLAAAQAVEVARQGASNLQSEAENQLHSALLASHIRRTLSGHRGSVDSVAWSPDGRRLATGSEDKTANVWDADTGKVLLTLSGHDAIVHSVAWSPDGKRLATGSWDKTAKVWDATTGKVLQTLSGHNNDIHSVAWSPDGKRLATGSEDKTAKVWDADTGKVLLTLNGHNAPVTSVAWSPDGSLLATTSDDQTAKVWDAATGKELVTLRGNGGRITSVAWSPDGKQLATASDDQTAKVWDAATGKELRRLSGHRSILTSVAWSPDGKQIATAGLDYKTKVWDVVTGDQVLTLSGYGYSVFSVAWSPDGKRIATASDGNVAQVWDATWGKELLTLSGHSDVVYSVAWSPDGKRLATASGDGTAEVWNANTGNKLLTLEPVGQVYSVAWSPDGKRLATGNESWVPLVWDAATGKELVSLRGHSDRVMSVAWSPDGKRLATASWDKTAKVWDADTGKVLLTLSGHDASVHSVAWSPDGKRLTTGSAIESAKVWDAATGKELLTLSGVQSAGVVSVAWSPDGKRLATARDGDRSARVWDAATGKERLTLRGDDSPVFSVGWSPDGKRLATGGLDGLVQVYAVDLRELMALARERVTAHPSDVGCQKYLHLDKCPPVPVLP